MTDLVPITALGGSAQRVETFGVLTLRENASLGLASLALRTGQAVPAPFGLTLPGVGGAAFSGPIGAFWTGRDQWMIMAENKAETDFAASLKAEVPQASVTEQTDGWVAFDISARDGAGSVEAAMRKLINIDPKALGPGRATRTGLEHMSVFVIRSAVDRCTFVGMRSYAEALWHALGVAARRQEI